MHVAVSAFDEATGHRARASPETPDSGPGAPMERGSPG